MLKKKNTRSNKKGTHYLSDWIHAQNWSKKAKAVRKPCWEIRYCPYGPLVEDFPTLPVNDERRCRVFGHQCPVFSVAEPFTETKELRNISREIPRSVQFRVFKRDNQVCSACGNTVREESIEFDHIIPWSKGGASDEHNIRLLCRDCNRKKGKNFEHENLIKAFNYHFAPLQDEGTVDLLLTVFERLHEFVRDSNCNPKPEDLARLFSQRKATDAEFLLIHYFNEMEEFFLNKRPSDFTPVEFKGLKLRWGFKDRDIYPLKDVGKYLDVDLDLFVKAERNLLERLGLSISSTKAVVTRWKKL